MRGWAAVVCLNIHRPSHLRALALFDNDVFSRGNGHVERAEWSSNIKRNLVKMSQNGKAVCPDFVGSVAVAGDAIGSDYDGPNSSRCKQSPRSTVAQQTNRNSQFF